MADPVSIGIVVVSDRASRGDYEDLSGPAIADYVEAALAERWQQEYRLIPDERETIAATLIELTDEKNCSLILVSGGTGPARATSRRKQQWMFAIASCPVSAKRCGWQVSPRCRR